MRVAIALHCCAQYPCEAGDPLGVTAAQQAALPPRRHSLLQQGVALLRRLLLRGYLWACVWLRPTPGPDFSTRLRRADPGDT